MWRAIRESPLRNIAFSRTVGDAGPYSTPNARPNSRGVEDVAPLQHTECASKFADRPRRRLEGS